ncbi:helix-hairpin-helix domain-containing protein [Hydrogenophaga sp. 5NK40-0174]|uniref:helix-hairpin-helix domain-containing protein n=1 Tax=Hydrogenophaga sp. 5NK40-0174 TaxID=3127649 RepID=UPI0031099759
MANTDSATTRPRFSDEERARMLALKGVGPTVIQRLEEIGFSSLAELAEVEPTDVNRQVASMLGATCWANSPLARQAIADVVTLAKTSSIR